MIRFIKKKPVKRLILGSKRRTPVIKVSTEPLEFAPAPQLSEDQINQIADKIAERLGANQVKTIATASRMPQDEEIKVPPRKYIAPVQPSLIRETGMEVKLGEVETKTSDEALDQTAQALAQVLNK